MRTVSVTEALSPFSRLEGIPAKTLEAAQRRGTLVHGAVKANLTGNYVIPLPGDYQGYYDSFCLWKESFLGDVLRVEFELFSTGYGIMGHPDFLCTIKGSPASVLVDIKTPYPKGKLWRLQMVGYKFLCSMNDIRVDRCLTIRLRPDGSMPLVDEYRDSPRDLEAFLAAANAVRYIQSLE